jgi:hypothetical protein
VHGQAGGEVADRDVVDAAAALLDLVGQSALELARHPDEYALSC